MRRINHVEVSTGLPSAAGAFVRDGLDGDATYADVVSALSVSWSGFENVSGFDVAIASDHECLQQLGDAVHVDASATSASVATVLEEGATYFSCVRGTGAGRATPWIASDGVTIDRTPPRVPAVVNAVDGFNQVTLSWAPSTDDRAGVAGYEVLLCAEGACDPSAEPLYAGLTLNFVAITGLAPCQRYSFAVRARDRAGNASALSAVAAADSQLPTPAGFHAVSSFGRVEAAWSPANGAESYELCYGTSFGACGENTIAVGQATAAEVALPGPEIRTFSVRARTGSCRSPAALDVAEPQPALVSKQRWANPVSVSMSIFMTPVRGFGGSEVWVSDGSAYLKRLRSSGNDQAPLVGTLSSFFGLAAIDLENDGRDELLASTSDGSVYGLAGGSGSWSIVASSPPGFGPAFAYGLAAAGLRSYVGSPAQNAGDGAVVFMDVPAVGGTGIVVPGLAGATGAGLGAYLSASEDGAVIATLGSTLTTGAAVYAPCPNGGCSPLSTIDTTAASSVRTRFVGDIDGDGVSDAIVHSFAGGAPLAGAKYWVVSGATGAATMHDTPSGRDWRDVFAIGDLDGDGRTEIAFVEYQEGPGGAMAVLVAATVRDQIVVPFAASVPMQNAQWAQGLAGTVSDLDDDGVADLVILAAGLRAERYAFDRILTVTCGGVGEWSDARDLSLSTSYRVPSASTSCALAASGGVLPYTFAIVENRSGATLSGATFTAGAQSGVFDTVRVTDDRGVSRDLHVFAGASSPPLSVRRPVRLALDSAATLSFVPRAVSAVGYVIEAREIAGAWKEIARVGATSSVSIAAFAAAAHGRRYLRVKALTATGESPWSAVLAHDFP